MMFIRSAIVVALFSSIALFGITRTDSYSLPRAATDLESTMTAAVDLARVTGDGATVTFQPGANNSTVVALWAHRPIPGSTMEVQPRRSFTTNVSISVVGVASSPALLIATSGYTSVTQWTPGGGTLGADGTCPSGTLRVTLTREGVSQKYTIPCSALDEMQ